MSKWLEISSAPKDGSTVLAITDGNTSTPELCWYERGGWRHNDVTGLRPKKISPSHWIAIPKEL